MSDTHTYIYIYIYICILMTYIHTPLRGCAKKKRGSRPVVSRREVLQGNLPCRQGSARDKLHTCTICLTGKVPCHGFMLRLVSVLRLWISEGLTQAESLAKGVKFPGP